jgi:threonyl-tRNA synthetase
MDVAEKLSENDIRVEVDHSSEKLGYKIRRAQLQKTPYVLVVGEKEMTGKNVSVRSRKEGNIGAESLNQFIERVSQQIEEKTNDAP